MLDEIDNRFELIKQEFVNNNVPTEMICKAYEMARNLHKDQRRKDGNYYISHPIEVAITLSNLGFDQNVISAALLHDVVEDCDCSLETIKKEFNNQVAEMVDCVSAIDKAKFVYDEDDVYEDVNFEKAAMEEQSFKKLIAIGKKKSI